MKSRLANYIYLYPELVAKIEEKLERAAEQSSLDNQMSIFDLFPDF
jgi:hypothetical protein